MQLGSAFRRTTLVLLHGVIWLLVIASVIQVYGVLAGIIQRLVQGDRLLLTGALVTALALSGGLLFWICKAAAAEFGPSSPTGQSLNGQSRTG